MVADPDAAVIATRAVPVGPEQLLSARSHVATGSTGCATHDHPAHTPPLAPYTLFARRRPVWRGCPRLSSGRRRRSTRMARPTCSSRCRHSCSCRCPTNPTEALSSPSTRAPATRRSSALAVRAPASTLALHARPPRSPSTLALHAPASTLSAPPRSPSMLAFHARLRLDSAPAPRLLACASVAAARISASPASRRRLTHARTPASTSARHC